MKLTTNIEAEVSLLACCLVDNKIEGWRIRVGSALSGMLGGARGVIIPHQFVKAIGDVFIVNKASLPSRDEGMAPDAGSAEELM